VSRRVALYGGSFDPPHLGHVFAVAWALSVHDVDEVWVLPVCKHAFGKEPTDFATRMSWCDAAFELFGERVQVRADEQHAVDAGGNGTTVALVEYLLERVEEPTSFAVMIGTDQLPDLGRWHRYDDLCKLVEWLVVGRQGSVDSVADASVVIPNVSSTAIRVMLAHGQRPVGLVPHRVLERMPALGDGDD